ncbi:hypothetical protein ACG9ZJ_21410 [Acinetobacter sp. ULE_I064]|uniref:hypothetical protein n=1 Tax=Acinetobacter sp. ULE_I064 TaxID=3373071 RepID=UPI003AF7FE5E
MLNSEFILMVESMGFYSVKSIVKYLNSFDTNVSLNERPVEYWLKGKRTHLDLVPDEVQEIFLKLKKFQRDIIEKEQYNLINNSKCSYTYLYKTEMFMWNNHPELYGLPVAFLNQIVIRLDLSLDYFENHELNINE